MILRRFGVSVFGLSLLSVSAASFAFAEEIGDIYQQVFDSVSQPMYEQTLKQLTGYLPVTVNGQTFKITNRYSSRDKANFRAYFIDYFKSLGIQATEMAYPTRHTSIEANGHNVEAILPGKSKDSLVIIIHYDSMGEFGHETDNPAVDDDMTGMAMMLETARVLAPLRGQLRNTIRFVAADFEEWASPGLEGARTYARHIKQLSTQQGFRIVAGIDNEQSGWNCASDQACNSSVGGHQFDIFSCSPTGTYNFKAIGDAMQATAQRYGKLKVNRDCMGANSDHYAMWEIGVPSVVFSEHDPFSNPHFDATGHDTLDKIDLNYVFQIAQIAAVFAAQTAGLN